MPEAFRSLLTGLAASLNLPEIPEQDGFALVAIDDFEVCLRLLPSGQALLYTVVAPLPAEGRSALMASLLEANTLFLATQGFTLSAREDTGVMLQGCMAMSALHDGNVAQWVENFVNVAEHWQGRCRACADNAAEAPAAGESSFDIHALMGMMRV